MRRPLLFSFIVLATLFTLFPSIAGSTTYYGSHLSTTFPWMSLITVFNTGDASSEITVMVRNSDGDEVWNADVTVPANGFIDLMGSDRSDLVSDDAAVMLPAVEGTFFVETTSEAVIPQLTYWFNQKISLCNILLSDTLSSKYAITNTLSDSFSVMGLAVMNSNDTTLTIDLAAYTDGTLIGKTSTAIAPGTKYVTSSDEIWSGLSLEDIDLIIVSSTSDTFPQPMALVGNTVSNLLMSLPVKAIKPYDDGEVLSDEVIRPDGWTEATHGKDAIPDYDQVFNDNVVGRIDLTIGSSDWEAMMTDETIVSTWGTFGGESANSRAIPGPGGAVGGGVTELSDNPIWIPCTLTYNGITWNHVGVRLKGNSSLHDAWMSGTYKMPFRFDFDEFEDTYPEIDNQRFYGFKKLTLSSGFKDDSLIREKITADIFRALGVPAPRTAFYRLFIDCGDGQGSKYFGLYTMVEVPDDPMLETQFGNSNGNLYKPDGTTASFGAGPISEDDFDKETNKSVGDYSDVTALYTAINDVTRDNNDWQSNLESVFDVDGFLNWLAVNTVVQNWDTYGIMTHNYYLYNDNGVLKWIPWDNNEALKGSDLASRPPLSLELDESSLVNWPLINRILAQSDYFSKYQEYCEKTVINYFNTANMQGVYSNAHNLIYDYVVGDEGEQEGYSLLSSPSDFTYSLDYLNNHVEQRENTVEKYLYE